MANQCDEIRLDQPQVDALLEKNGNDGAPMLVTLKRVIQGRLLEANQRVRLVLADTVTREGSRAVPEGQKREIGDLHRQIKGALNKLLKGGRAHLTSDGSLLVTDTLPPFLQDPDVIQQHFEGLHMGGANDVLGQIDLETWQKHLSYSMRRVREKQEEHLNRKRVRYKKKECSDPFGWKDTEMIIRGCAGELLLQTMLSRMRSETFDREERDVVLLDQDRQFVFPEACNNGQCVYSLWFTTDYNCELRTRKEHDEEWCVTEFDGVLLSGLKPGETDYSRFYIFDVTLDREKFREKVLHKLKQLQDFITAMDAQGIQVHIFSVLFYRRDSSGQIERSPFSATERSHAIALPLLDIVNHIVILTKDDLEKKLNALLVPTDQK